MANSGLLAKRLANANHPQSNPPEIHTQAEPKKMVSQNMSKTEDHDILNKKNKTEESSVIFSAPEPEKTEAQIEIETLKKHHEEQKKMERWKLSTRIINIFLVAACVYVLFLIYGVLVTDYQYSDNGTIEPQTLTVSEIKDKKNFEEIYYQYLHCRNLYEKVLLLDYRMGKGEEDPLTLAPEYESMLDEVSDLSIKTDALEVDSQYSQIKSLLLTWIKDDIAVYLQNMSAAISKNDADTANNALQDKDRVYSDFSVITQNIAATGENIKGVDITDVKEWTPENYVDEEINGK